MKRGIICIIIVCGLSTLAVVSLVFITNVSDEIIGKIELVEKYYDGKDYESAVMLAREAEETWERFYKKSFLITEVDMALEISITLSRIVTLTQEEDNEMRVECQSVLVVLEHFKEKQKPTIYNIM